MELFPELHLPTVPPEKIPLYAAKKNSTSNSELNLQTVLRLDATSTRQLGKPIKGHFA